MNTQELLLKKLHQAMNLMICESKISRSYGAPSELTSSEIDLLKCVQRNREAKISELAAFLGVTIGAVTQLTAKLEKKTYLEPYRVSGNKKEKYYRLTTTGETACRGYDEYSASLMSGVDRYLSSLDEETVKKMVGLFDAFIESLAGKARCSIKHEAGRTGETSEQKRCEKCQKVY